MITKHRLDSVYAVADFDAHSTIKHELLNLIDQSPAQAMINEIDNLNITKADWDNATDFSRPWVQFLLKDLQPHLGNIFKFMGFDMFKIHEIWFQQYNQQASHGWHTHGSNFTNVYYVELEEDAPRTVLINPYTREEFSPDVKEGQTLVFPSYVIHKSPDDFFENRKTIISWNSNVDIQHPYIT